MAEETIATSVRLPADLQKMAKAAVDKGLARSLTALVVDGLRDRLVQMEVENQDHVSKAEARAALEEHYAEHPEARPSLAEIAGMAAELFGEPGVDRPDLIELAIADLGDDAHYEEVLSWVRGAVAATSPQQEATPQEQEAVA